MRKVWTKEEEAKLRDLYPNTSSAELAEIFGLRISQIYNKANLMGLRKTKEYVASATKKAWESGVLNTERNKCFKKGHISFNKGKKQAEYMSSHSIKRTAKTRFKKGHTPINHRSLGSTRVNVDGYVEIKIQEPNKWALLHREVWREIYGEIPGGYNVQFKDGNRQNVSIDNLYLIHRKEQMSKNSVMNYPEEVREIIRLKAVLTRKSNQITNGSKK